MPTVSCECAVVLRERWKHLACAGGTVVPHKRAAGIVPNVYVYGKLRVFVRGFSEGKSDVTKLQLTWVKH